jgi:filamentous hemagglutinin family protein
VNTINSQSRVVTRRSLRRGRAAVAVACAVAPIVAGLTPRASAGVQLSSVAHGSAAVSQSGSVTTIRTGTNNTILYFSKFDIAAGSTVNFAQPSAAGRVLDHVTSPAPSMINGTLRSNGSVYLVNPAGVIFGAGAVVDVNRFYAAAASFSNQDFLAGVDHFTNISGLISNSGQIRANQVSLIGSQVINQGSIVAPDGVVAMLAGSDVLVSEQGSHITAKVVPVSSSSSDLRNSPLAAGDVYALAIRHTGDVQAANVLINGGGGQVDVSGSITASTGATGGTVAITGGQVNLASASINASGPAGGGSVQIGGGSHGSGDLPHAQNVSVDSNTTIDADATGNGDGGSIVLWSDGLTAFAGSLTARGGPLGGNGGFIETSGYNLQALASPDASAPNGDPGTWLLDPVDVDIQNGADDANLTGSTIYNQTIVDTLQGGTDVTISTDQSGADTGTLTQEPDAPIDVTLGSNQKLTLQSNALMLLQGGITATGSTLDVELDQLNNGAVASVSITTNPININGSLTIYGGNVSATAGLTASNISIASNTSVVGLSTSTFSASLGTVNVSAPVVTGGTFASAGTSFTSTGSGTINTSGGDVTINPTGTIAVGAAINSGGGSVSLTSTSAAVTTTAGITTGGGAFNGSGSSFSNGAAISTGGGVVTLDPAGPVTVSGTITTGGGGLAVTGTAFTDNSNISDGNIGTGAGNFTVDTTSGLVAIYGAITWTGAANRAVVIEGAADVDLEPGGSISSTGASPLNVSMYTTGVSNNVLISGTVNISGAFVASGGSFVVSNGTDSLTAQSISLNNATKNFDNVTVTPASVEISGPITTTGGGLIVGGTTLFYDNNGTLSTTGGGVQILNTGATISLGVPVSISGGDLIISGGGTFTSSGDANTTIDTNGGNVSINTTSDMSVGEIISSGGGDVTLNTSAGGIKTTAMIDTGGGAFTATTSGATSVSNIAFENDAEITDGASANGAGAFQVNVTSGGSLNVGGAIVWTGSSVTLQGAGDVNILGAGSIGPATAALPVNLYNTGSSKNISIAGTISTAGALVASGGNITVQSTGSVTAQSISLNIATTGIGAGDTLTPGTVTVSGPIATTGGSLLIGGITYFVDNGNGTIDTDGGDFTITNNGAFITLGNPVTTEGGKFTTTLGGTFTNAGSGTITTSGGDVTITTTEDCGISADINTGGGNFTVNSPSFELSQGQITDGGGSIGNDTLSITTTTGDINLGADVVWTGSATPLHLAPASGANLDLGGSLTVNNGATLDLSGVTAALTGTATVTGGTVTFGSIINGTTSSSVTTTPDLTIQSIGPVTLAAVGTSDNPIGSITVAANGASPAPTTILNNDIFVAGDAIFGGPVNLAANIDITDNGEDFSANGNVEFDSPVEGPNGLTINNVVQTRINANIGDVTPLAYLDLVPGTSGIIFIRGGSPNSSGLGLPATQQATTTIDIASGGNFEVNFGSAQERVFSPLFATVDSYGPLTINIGSSGSPNAANLVSMGQNEKITSIGSLTINTNGGTAAVGDLSAFGNITIDSANIQFVLREPSVVNNATYDSGMDLIAAGQISLPAGANYTTVQPSGSGAFDVPGFIALSFDPSSNIASTAANLKTVISIAKSITTTPFYGPENLLLDVTPATLGATIPSYIPPVPFVFDYPIGGAVPRQQLVAGTVPVDFKTAFQPAYPGPVLQQDLIDDGVFTREPTFEEIVAAAEDVVVYQDIPEKGRPRVEDFSVAAPRINPHRARKFLDSYQAIFGGQGSSSDVAAGKTRIAADIQSAWDAYVLQNGYRPATGAGFQQYCARTPAAAKVSADLAQFNDLFQQLVVLGLTHKEAAEFVQYKILAGLSANGMQDRDLLSAVENAGPSQ